MLVADVFLVSLIDKNGNIFASSTLQSGNIDVQVQQNDVRGGRGNQIIAVLNSSRDINITLTDAEFRYDWLAVQLGQTIKTGAGTAWAAPKWYTVESDGTITLEETPLTTDSGLKIYDVDGKEITKGTTTPTTGQYTITDNKVTFHNDMKGKDVEVRGYKYTTSAETQTIEIDNSKFPKGVQCVLETLEIDGDENPKFKLQYVFDSCLPTGNFTINTASERTAQAQEFGLRIIKPKTSNIVGRLLRIPITS